MSHKSAGEINTTNEKAMEPHFEIAQSDIKKLREAIGLLNSMVLSGEQHDKQSEQVFEDAVRILRKMV